LHRFSIRYEFDVPDGAFMALPLTAGALADCGGVVKYPPEFSDL